MSFQDIRTDYEDFWLRSQTYWNSFLRNAEVSLKAYAGRTWTEQEAHQLLLEGRTPQEFDVIRPKVQLFSGYARDNIKSTVVGPVENGDQLTADELTETMKFVHNKADYIPIILNAFDDALKTGIALVGIYIDYSRDPIFGDIKYYKRSFNSFIIDPNWERPDMSDASEVLLRDFVTREEAKALLPMIDPKEIEQIPAFSTDNKFKYMRNNQRFFKSKNLISYDQYYRKVTKNVKEIINMETGSAIPFFGSRQDRDFLEEKMRFAKNELGLDVELIERKKQVVELNVILTGQVVHTMSDPTGLEDEYPFAPVLCHWEPQLDDFGLKLQGIPFGMIDVQRAINRRQIRKQDIMDAAINQGFMYRVGEVDVEDIHQTGVGKMIPVNSTQPFEQVLRELGQGNIPPSWQQESEFLQSFAYEISGINETLMGSDEGGNTQVSGRLAEVRAANGLRANRSIFDNFERFQKYMGSKTLKAIQINYGPGKIRRILGKEPSPQFFSRQFDQYDAVIKQAVLSQTQKDSFYFELLKLIEIYGPDHIPVSLAIKNIPMAGASELQMAIEQKEQEQKKIQEAAEEDRQRLAALQQSVTEQNLSLAQERRARAIANIGLAQERQSEIRQNIAASNLDQIKTLAEIEKLSDENLIQLMQFLRFLQAQEEQMQNKDLSEDLAIVQNISEQTQGGQNASI